ncbi:hypothetical protein B0H15DRAFT_796483 [Mycena belliarum]|uniref:Uncharacterized protein n=2 Tax=Mycena belliarum TaxID=1033014 RepID=A0AAD6UEF7_9AGAR|nr:hypothetical protein B0H15DRAFT_796483 [Mycena belliae]
MSPKRVPADPEVKAQRRQEALARYRASHAESLRTSSRKRMAQRRAEPVSGELQDERHEKKLEAAAVYRDRNREAIREADTERRRQAYIEENGLAAYKARELLRYVNKTQGVNEEHPPPRRPAPVLLTNQRKRRKLAIERPSEPSAPADASTHEEGATCPRAGLADPSKRRKQRPTHERPGAGRSTSSVVAGSHCGNILRLASPAPDCRGIPDELLLAPIPTWLSSQAAMSDGKPLSLPSSTVDAQVDEPLPPPSSTVDAQVDGPLPPPSSKVDAQVDGPLPPPSSKVDAKVDVPSKVDAPVDAQNNERQAHLPHATEPTANTDGGPLPQAAADSLAVPSCPDLGAPVATTEVGAPESNQGSRAPSPGNEVVDLSDVSTPPASPSPPKAPRVRKTLRAPPRPDRLPLPSRVRAERAATRLEAAAQRAEAAAMRILEDAARTRARAVRVELTARRMSQQAEKIFYILQRAGEAARLIGQDADELVALLARPSSTGGSSAGGDLGPSATGSGPSATGSGPSAGGDSSAPVPFASLVADEAFAEWFARQKLLAFV